LLSSWLLSCLFDELMFLSFLGVLDTGTYLTLYLLTIV
jgi:hypothetical protein